MCMLEISVFTRNSHVVQCIHLLIEVHQGVLVVLSAHFMDTPMSAHSYIHLYQI